MSCQSQTLAGHCSSSAQLAWESKTHTSILLRPCTHTHSCTTEHLLSCLVAVNEYREDESIIQSSTGVYLRVINVGDYFLCQQMKCKTNMNRIQNFPLNLTYSFLTLTFRCEDYYYRDIMFTIFKMSIIIIVKCYEKKCK